jgi:cytochrome c biogenesis protein CcdA
MPDPITLFQTWIANWATDVMALLPIGYAFGAGMVSTVNPCGFAMLPAYLSLYIGTGEEGFVRRSPLVRAAKAVYIGSIVTLGFVVLFGLVGLGIAAGGQMLLRLMPWAGLATGVVLAVIGVMLLSGKHLYAGLAARLAARVGTQGASGVRAFFLFGIGYATASLACTLPIFLVVVGSSIAARGILGGFYQFISYALGMGLVLVVLTLGMALFKGATVGSFRAVLPYVERISAVLILLMGSYLVYYWLTKGGLLRYLT